MPISKDNKACDNQSSEEHNPRETSRPQNIYTKSESSNSVVVSDERSPLLESFPRLSSSSSADNAPNVSFPKSTLLKRLLARQPILSLLPTLIVCVIIWNIPPPTSSPLSPTSMHLLAVFVAIIFGVLTSQYDLTMLVGLGIVVLAYTKTAMCVTKSGEKVECRSCDGLEYKCDGSKDTFEALLKGYSNHVGWLVFAAFQIGKAVEVTGLGKRISLLLLKYLGKSILGVAWSICLCEYLLGLLIPSNTARGGGVVMPIVVSVIEMLSSTTPPSVTSSSNNNIASIPPRSQSLSYSASSSHSHSSTTPDDNSESNVERQQHNPFKSQESSEVNSISSTESPPIAQFLILTSAHANLISAAFHITGMAANPIVSATAKQVLNIDFGFTSWIIGGLIPAIVLMFFLPILIGFLTGVLRIPNVLSWLKEKSPAELEDIEAEIRGNDEQHPSDGDVDMHAVREMVEIELMQLGSVTPKEKQLLAILAVALLLWATSSITRLDSALVAFSAVMVLCYLETITIDMVMKNYKAWDVYFWLGGFIALSDQLTHLSITTYLGTLLSSILPTSFFPAIFVAVLFYMYNMYLFSSLTGHIMAFVGPVFVALRTFLGDGLNGDIEANGGKMVVALIGYFGCLCGCLTYYSSGPIVIYFGIGHVKSIKWLLVGFIVSLVYIIVLFTAGLLWWKVLGWW